MVDSLGRGLRFPPLAMLRRCGQIVRTETEVRDHGRADFPQRLSEAHIRLLLFQVRDRERCADSHPDRSARRSWSPGPRGVEAIAPENHAGNNGGVGQPCECGGSLFGNDAAENGSGARANAALGKHPHPSSSAESLDAQPQRPMVRPRAIHRKSVDCSQPGRSERIGVKFLCRHPVDCSLESAAQEDGIEMRDVIGHHDRGARRFHRAGRAPDVQTHERSRNNAYAQPGKDDSTSFSPGSGDWKLEPLKLTERLQAARRTENFAQDNRLSNSLP